MGAKARLKQALKLRPDYADAKRNLDEVVAMAKLLVKKAGVKSVVKNSLVAGHLESAVKCMSKEIKECVGE